MRGILAGQAETPDRDVLGLAIRRPDLDKLVRATLDGLGSANIWTDDSQVVSMNVSKRLAEIDEVTGCRIVVERVG